MVTNPSGAPRRSRADLLARRDALVIVLTLVTGATDAIGFTKLGGVFTSVMTGNMVLLGVAAGRGDATLAIHTGIAFLCYGAGTFAGARIAGPPSKDGTLWPRSITVALLAELATFCLFTVGWEAAGAMPTGAAALALLGVNAIALGIQSSAVLRFGIGGLSTTYLTGTLTAVLAGVATRSDPRGSRRSVLVLAALVVGAAIGAIVAIHAPHLAPAMLLLPLGMVVTTAVRHYWRDGGTPSS